jgi:hypothetical protein
MKLGFLFSMISLAAIADSPSFGSASIDMAVASQSFKNNEFLSKDYTCDGKDLSPEIHWSFSGKAKSFAIACEDPDAPGGNFVHWIIYNIPGTEKSISSGFPAVKKSGEILQGVNNFGRIGYNGPCPPKGKPHRYVFTVYALDFSLKDPGLDIHEFKRLIKGRVIASGSITGLYQRK